MSGEALFTRSIAHMNRTGKFVLVCGSIGLAVPVGIMVFDSNPSSNVLFTFWPTSIFGFGFNGPTFSPLGLFIGAIEFGGNFILYALLGFLLATLSKSVWRRS